MVVGFHPQTHVRTFKSTRMTINQRFVSIISENIKKIFTFGFIMWRLFELTSRCTGVCTSHVDLVVEAVVEERRKTFKRFIARSQGDGQWIGKSVYWWWKAYIIITLLLHTGERMIDDLATLEKFIFSFNLHDTLWMKWINR